MAERRPLIEGSSLTERSRRQAAHPPARPSQRRASNDHDRINTGAEMASIYPHVSRRTGHRSPSSFNPRSYGVRPLRPVRFPLVRPWRPRFHRNVLCSRFDRYHDKLTARSAQITSTSRSVLERPPSDGVIEGRDELVTDVLDTSPTSAFISACGECHVWRLSPCQRDLP